MSTKKPLRITAYRVDQWLHKGTNDTLYGVSVKIEGLKGWIRVASNSVAVILDTRTEAEAYIASMKTERDERGFRMEKAA